MQIPVLSDRVDVRPFRVRFGAESWHLLIAAPQRIDDLVAVATVAGLRVRNRHNDGMGSATAAQIAALERTCP